MNIPNYVAAVLDMDGVITRTASIHARAWKETFDAYLGGRGENAGEQNRPFDIVTDYRKYVDGKPRYEGVESFLESRGIHLPWGEPGDDPARETICGLGNRKNELFREILGRDGAHVFDDTVEQIGRWKARGLKIGVFSSSRNCLEVLDRAGLSGLFDATVDGNDLARLDIQGKPAPDMLVEAARRVGSEPGKTLVAEDSVAGVEAGRRGGFRRVVGVDRDGTAAGLRDAGADIVVRDLREIAAADHCPPGEDCLSRPAPAVRHADWLARHLAGERIALFLDYDGTLTPIVRRPEDAVLSGEMRSLVERLAGQCTVAVVSGRDRRDVEGMVGIESLVYAGSHGFDIRGPGGLSLEHEAAVDVLPDVDATESELKKELETIDGARVERKRFAVAVHYRNVEDEQSARRVESIVDAAVERRPSLRRMSGKKVFELQPDVDWNKGRAVEWLREALGVDDAGTVTIYIGDDTTDEDAFAALRRRGCGIGVRVGAALEKTEALYYVKDCGEVRRFLESLAGVPARAGGKDEDE